MPVSATYTNPSAGGTLDLSAGAVVTETVWDALISNILYLGGVSGGVTQIVSAAMGTNFSTTSSGLVDVTSGVLTMTTTGGSVLLFFSGPAHAVTGNGAIAFSQDGVDGATVAAITAGGQLSVPMALVTRYTPSAGAHTWKVRASVSAGTLTMSFLTIANGFFLAVEVRR